MGHKDLGVRNYNPSLAAQQSKTGKSYLARIRKMEPYERFLYWIRERQQIHMNRFPDGMVFGPNYDGSDPQQPYNNGNTQPEAPWTEDPIFQTVFFCNVYRENDKVTAYQRGVFRQPFKHEPCALMGNILLRWYNFIPTMQFLVDLKIPQRLGNPKPAAKALREAVKELVELRDHGSQLFGGAYIIRPIVDGKTGARKVESITELLQSMVECKTLYQEVSGAGHSQWEPPTPQQLSRMGSTCGADWGPGSMAYAFARLNSFSGMGKFYCYQFIGDLAYTHVLRDAPDWFTWSFCGPGTSRGLVRLKCPSGKATLPNGKRLPRMMPLQRGWQEQLLDLQKQVNKDLKTVRPETQIKPTSRITLGTFGETYKRGGEVRQLQYIHMRDLTNCLCEYDKYERALFNERSIKRPYHGT
jgi:5-hmdU DNA kinase-like protein